MLQLHGVSMLNWKIMKTENYCSLFLLHLKTKKKKKKKTVKIRFRTKTWFSTLFEIVHYKHKTLVNMLNLTHIFSTCLLHCVK